MLTGRLPFIGTTPMEVMEQHVRSAPPVPHEVDPKIPKALSELILKLLSKDPGERPDAEQVKADLKVATKQLRNAATMMSLQSIDQVQAAPATAQAERARGKELARKAEVADLKRKAGRNWPVILGGFIGVWFLGVVVYVMLPNTVVAPATKPVARKEPKAVVRPPVDVEEPVKPVVAHPIAPVEPVAPEDEPVAVVDAGEPEEVPENRDEVRDDVFLGEWRRSHAIDEKLSSMAASMKIDPDKRQYFATPWGKVNDLCAAANTLRTLNDCQDELEKLEKRFYKTE
jgi:serine/threonine-protein kinase